MLKVIFETLTAFRCPISSGNLSCHERLSLMCMCVYCLVRGAAANPTPPHLRPPLGSVFASFSFFLMTAFFATTGHVAAALLELPTFLLCRFFQHRFLADKNKWPKISDKNNLEPKQNVFVKEN